MWRRPCRTPTCPGNSQPATSGLWGTPHNLLLLPHLHSPCLAAPSLLLVFWGFKLLFHVDLEVQKFDSLGGFSA